MNRNSLNSDFQKAQKLTARFGEAMQKQDESLASKLLTFALGHYTAMLDELTPKKEVEPEIKVKTVEPEVVKEIELYDKDFIISID